METCKNDKSNILELLKFKKENDFTQVGRKHCAKFKILQ